MAAQWLAMLLFEPEIVGSIPAATSSFSSYFEQFLVNRCFKNLHWEQFNEVQLQSVLPSSKIQNFSWKLKPEFTEIKLVSSLIFLFELEASSQVNSGTFIAY